MAQRKGENKSNERRGEDRRKQNVEVEVDRRKQEDRRTQRDRRQKSR